MRGLFVVLLALVCLAAPADAQTPPLPDYDTCALTWYIAGYNVYFRSTPTGPPVKAGFVPINGPDDSRVIKIPFPCPTAQGTYYVTLTTVDSLGQEGAHNAPFGFTIKNPPPLVLAIGGQAQVVTALLNVRPAPTTVNSCVKCPTVAKGVIGTILDGPISADGFVWWKLSWGGWSAAAKGAAPYLVPVAPAP